VFSPFPLFDQWYFTSLWGSGEAEMKKLQKSGQAHFLGASSPDSFPPDRFAVRRSRV